MVGTPDRGARADGGVGRSQSLYRKYRPTSFDSTELVGQEHVARTLRNAVRFGRVAHAYLFCGPRGSGKTSSARLLAKAVNCERADPAERPCNACLSCRTINEGRAVDIIEIDAASNRGIEDMRDLREKVKFAPAQLRTKFYIIDEVHQLTKEASNALLKTLEEPPPHVVFILATTDQEKVLETISSRCQVFVFHRIPVDKIIEHLRRLCGLEGIKADDAALAAIARAATGAMRDAVGLLDQLASYGDAGGEGGEGAGITVETVRQVLGAGGDEQVLALVDALAAGDVAAGLRTINATIEGGADARQFAGQLVAYLRALLHAAAAPPQRGERRPDEPGVAERHRDAFALAEVAALVKRFSQVDYGLRHSAYGHLPLELCLVDSVLAHAAGAGAMGSKAGPAGADRVVPPSRPVSGRPGSAPFGDDGNARPVPPERAPTPIRPEVPPAPAGRGEVVEARADADVSGAAHVRPLAAPRPSSGADAPPAPPHAVAQDAVPSTTRLEADVPVVVPATPGTPIPAGPAAPMLSIEQVHELWPRIRQGVKAVNRRIEAILSSVNPHTLADGVLTIVAVYPFHHAQLNKDDCRTIIEDVVSQVLGHPHRVVCVMREEAEALPVPAPASTPRPTVPAARAVAPAPPAPPATREQAPPAPAGEAAVAPWEEPPPARPASGEAREVRESDAGWEPPTAGASPARGTWQASTVAGAAPGTGVVAAPDGGGGVDERYLNAVRNIFNAVEIRTESATATRARWDG